MEGSGRGIILNVGSNNRLNFAPQYQQRSSRSIADKSLNFNGITVPPGWQKQLNRLDMSEAWKRGVLGLVVLFVKSPSDYFSNWDKDEKTRWASCLKIVDKIVIGTISGCAARVIGQRFAKNLIDKKIINLAKAGLNSEGKSVARVLAYAATFISMLTFDIPVMSRVIQATTNWVEKSIKSDSKKDSISKKPGVNAHA